MSYIDDDALLDTSLSPDVGTIRITVKRIRIVTRKQHGGEHICGKVIKNATVHERCKKAGGHVVELVLWFRLSRSHRSSRLTIELERLDSRHDMEWESSTNLTHLRMATHMLPSSFDIDPPVRTPTISANPSH